MHLNIERRLTDLVGDAGKRLHTAARATTRWPPTCGCGCAARSTRIVAALRALRRAFVDLAERHADTIMPGFTHLQVAQPVTFGHHLLAYDAMFARDLERLPTAAGASTACRWARLRWPARRFRSTAHAWRSELGFEAVAENSLDAVTDRDFAIEFDAAAALLMVHLSRFAEELVLWSSPRFGFVRLRRPLLHRQLDHAAEEESGRAGARARQERPRHRPPGGAARC